MKCHLCGMTGTRTNDMHIDPAQNKWRCAQCRDATLFPLPPATPAPRAIAAKIAKQKSIGHKAARANEIRQPAHEPCTHPECELCASLLANELPAVHLDGFPGVEALAFAFARIGWAITPERERRVYDWKAEASCY